MSGSSALAGAMHRVGLKTGDWQPTQVTDKPGGLRGPAVPRDFLPEVKIGKAHV